jgi:hypothetical protein
MDFYALPNLVTCFFTRLTFCQGRGNRCRPSWTSRFPDREGMESATPFPLWRATFLSRDMAHEAVPCPFAKEIDALQVPPRKESCVLYRWQRLLRRSCAYGEGRAIQQTKNVILQNELN